MYEVTLIKYRMNSHFLKLQDKSSAVVEFFKCKKTEILESFDSSVYSGFYGYPVDNSIYLQDFALSKINEQFKILHGAFLKVSPNHSYHWHKDRMRGVSINMLLTFDSFSVTLFYENDNDYLNDTQQFKSIPLLYEPEHFFLFNTQKYHSVINFDSPRVIFSCLFEADKDSLSYDQLKDYCVTQGLANV